MAAPSRRRGRCPATSRASCGTVPDGARLALLFGLGALLSGLTILDGINPHDEGLVLQAAARVADGQLPYRDFYANYGPGQYFLAGGLDRVFGPSLLSWRGGRAELYALGDPLVFTLARPQA